jgi:PAT family beta-lactamase induction signal transducer AmpG
VALLYFAEGLPFGIVLDNLPLYFRVQGVSLEQVGLLSLLRLPWSAKPLWAPLVDQLGERRAWITGALLTMVAALLALQALPASSVGPAITGVLLLFTFAAATQDIAIDAYTIELLAPGEEGVANGIRVSAYRAALIAGGGLLVALAGHAGWRVSYLLAAVTLGVLALVVRRLPALPRRAAVAGEWTRALREWVGQPGAPAVALFVVAYKLSDTSIGPMIRPFWLQRGYGVAEIGTISTTVGVAASVVGALLGGMLTSRWGIFRALWILGLVQSSASLGYATVAFTDAGRPGIYAASLIESFTAGLGTAAFLAFLMRICDKRQAATQYALLSALFSVPGSFAGSVSGYGVAWLGYGPYFVLTFLLGLPAYALLPWVRRWIEAAGRDAAPPAAAA